MSTPRLSEVRAAASSYVGARVAIDTRSLALFRVALGATILLDILMRVRHLTYFYTSDGVVTAAHTLDGEFALSLFHLSDEPAFAVVFFLVYALVAFQFLLGWHTRLATVVLFLFVVSLHHRNPLVLNYGDQLLRLLLVWAIFLPLGERWSVDAARRSRDARPQVASLATVLILCQVVWVHLANGYAKATDGVWFDEPAVAYILARDHTTFLLGNYLREFTTLLRAASLLWVFMLVSAWALLVLRERERTVLLTLFVGFHTSMLLTRPMSVAPLVAIAGLLLFLQGSFWRDLRSLTVFFGVGHHYGVARKRAARLGERLPTRPRFVDNLSPQRLRRGVYYGGLAAAAIIVFLAPFAVSLAGVAADGPLPDHTEEIDTLTDPADLSSEALSLSQSSWGMHSSPSTMDQYYVFAAETTDGEFLDVYNDRALSFYRPSPTLAGHYESHRHRKHLFEVWRDDSGELGTALGDHRCTTWRETHNTELAYVNMYLVVESFDDEELLSPENRDRHFHVMDTHTCAADEPMLLEPADDGDGFTRGEHPDSGD